MEISTGCSGREAGAVGRVWREAPDREEEAGFGAEGRCDCCGCRGAGLSVCRTAASEAGRWAGLNLSLKGLAGLCPSTKA